MFQTNSIGLKGQYKLVITGKDKTTETDWFDNLITNIGMDRYGAEGGPAKYARVGRGTTPPAVTNTQLVNQVGASALGVLSSVVPYGAPGYESEIITRYNFTQGQITGNITEVGVGWATSGSTLFSRTLITDSDGVPRTLTLTSLDTLTIFYKVVWVPPLTDYTGTCTVDGTTIGYVSRIAQIGSFMNSANVLLSDWNSPYVLASGNSPSQQRIPASFYCAGATLGVITEFPQVPSTTLPPTVNSILLSGDTSANQLAYAPYVAGSYYRDLIIQLTTGIANLSTNSIQAVLLPFANSFYRSQIRFDTPITKRDPLSVLLRFRVSWRRV